MRFLATLCSSVRSLHLSSRLKTFNGLQPPSIRNVTVIDTATIFLHVIFGLQYDG